MESLALSLSRQIYMYILNRDRDAEKAASEREHSMEGSFNVSVGWAQT